MVSSSIPVEWMDDFDVLEFAQLANTIVAPSERLDVDQIAKSLIFDKKLSIKEYEIKKQLWRKDKTRGELKDQAGSLTKRRRTFDSNSIPRYCQS